MNDFRTIEEAYESACSTTDLGVEPDKKKPADILIAGGWSDSHLGMALLRLRSEWESSEKPRLPDPYLITKLGDQLNDQARKKIPPGPLDGHARAKTLAHTWYTNELKMLRLKLKGLPSVAHQLYLKAERKGIPREIIPQVMAWWLSQTCLACGGHGKTLIPGSPTLSAHDCQVCRGTGKKKLPEGQNGRWLANLMDSSVNSAKQSLKNRFVHQK